jgi:hypothetical protein
MYQQNITSVRQEEIALNQPARKKVLQQYFLGANCFGFAPNPFKFDGWLFPIYAPKSDTDTRELIRKAISDFRHVTYLTPEERIGVWNKIVKAAKKYGVEAPSVMPRTMQQPGQKQNGWSIGDRWQHAQSNG